MRGSVSQNRGDARTAVERVRGALHLAITSGSLPSGARLRETQIAVRYRVSRTPVREALRHLAAEGLVVILPHAGAQVAGFSIAEIDEIFEIRGALEVLAAGRAADRATPQTVKALRAQLQRCEAAVRQSDVHRQAVENERLHVLIYACAASPQLERVIQGLGDRLRQYRAASLSRQDRPREALDEHRALLAAITRRDIAATRELASRHAENARSAATRWYLEESRVEARRAGGGHR
jgi:DNA-binding GntR family transcriptional regulator